MTGVLMTRGGAVWPVVGTAVGEYISSLRSRGRTAGYGASLFAAFAPGGASLEHTGCLLRTSLTAMLMATYGSGEDQKVGRLHAMEDGSLQVAEAHACAIEAASCLAAVNWHRSYGFPKERNAWFVDGSPHFLVAFPREQCLFDEGESLPTYPSPLLGRWDAVWRDIPRYAYAVTPVLEIRVTRNAL
ncbi:hypothetical protein B2J93_7745 [Marssonina coronariae]|uniref:Uncharacterized protein n=1 Tax=Diplocarpon coronariae TaxID=2795749 RepID=A0A218ZFZ6_9HELO|nr:hypothetical protein B2J93_7745 [Marssonina coronariae]